MAALAVVIPTLAGGPALERVLDLLAADREHDVEVVVAADARIEDTASLGRLAAGRPWPASVVSGAQAGASAARNAGVAATRAPLVLFLGDDILPRPGLVAGHLEWHRGAPEPEVAVLGHVDWAPELARTAFMAWLDHGIQFDYPAITGTEAGWGRLNTANLSLKRELFERAGGFDQRFPFLYEDVDLARRLRDHGLRLLYHRGAAAYHLHEPTLDGWRRRMRMVGAAERAFVERYPDERPHFHERFSAALASPPARGLTARLIRWIPRSFPLLGPRAWSSADLLYGQALGPAFMSGWDDA